MSMQKIFHVIAKSSHVEKTFRIIMAVVVMCSIMAVGFVAPVSAAGATQISGIGYVPGEGECTDVVVNEVGQVADSATKMTGDLEGCQYVFVETHTCGPSGIYIETGSEIYILDGPNGQGTFNTTYRFQAKFEGCGADGFPIGAELFGGCQHPIVANTGTGDYEGVTGRLHFKDDIAAGNFPYTGHLKW